MYWMSRRSRRYSRPLERARSLPSKLIEPDVGLSSPTSIRPIVVLPQPDSPTRPSVSPLRMSNDTSATALTAPTRRCSTPLVTGKSLTRCLAESTTSPATAVAGAATSRRRRRLGDHELAADGLLLHADREEAAVDVRGGLPRQYRRLGAAAVGRVPAARREPAAGRRVDQVRRGAGNGVQPLPGLGRLLRQRVEERLGVRVAGVGVERRRVGRLHHLARVHDRDPVRAPGDHAEVVGDHDDRHAEPLPQVVDELEDLLLDGHVERGRRLVGDEQLGLAGQRHRDHHALPHAAGELVRVLVHPLPRPRHADQVEHLDRPLVGVLLGHLAVQQHRLGDLLCPRCASG